MTAILSLGLKCIFLFPWKNWNKWKDASLWGLICYKRQDIGEKRKPAVESGYSEWHSLGPPLTSYHQEPFTLPTQVWPFLQPPVAIQPETEWWDLSLTGTNSHAKKYGHWPHHNHYPGICILSCKEMNKFEILNTNDNPEDILGKEALWGCASIYTKKLSILLFYEIDPAKGKLLGDF